MEEHFHPFQVRIFLKLTDSAYMYLIKLKFLLLTSEEKSVVVFAELGKTNLRIQQPETTETA